MGQFQKNISVTEEKPLTRYCGGGYLTQGYLDIQNAD